MAASSRIGKNTGPGKLRRTATTRARISTRTSAIRKSCTFTRNARPTSGRESSSSSTLRNLKRNSSQPGELTATKTTIAMKIAVLASATATARRPSTRVPPPRIRERPSRAGKGSGTTGAPGGVVLTGRAASPSSLLQDGVGEVRQPLVLEALQRAVGLERGDREVHALHERIVLLEDQTEVLALRRELADDDAVLRLPDQDVHVGGRGIHDVAVDL